MRIGSLVSRERMNPEGQWFRPDGEPVGTVIAIEHQDRDGYEDIERLTVRWGNGAVSNVGLYSDDDDPQGDWAIVDVTPECYANLYLRDRAYGGPEEGGRWYDVDTPADGDWNSEPPQHGHFPSTDEALAASERLQEWCERENFTRRPPSSVLSEGHFVVKLEAWPAEPSPKNRPFYS